MEGSRRSRHDTKDRISAAHRPSRQRLQDGGDAERDQREAEHVDRNLGRQLGQLDHERGKDKLDAHQADVLEADQRSEDGGGTSSTP